MRKKLHTIKKKISTLAITTTNIKSLFVSRLFWGRGSLYKSAAHFIIFSITLFVALAGIVSRVSGVNVTAKSLNGSITIGSDDLLQQGGSITAILSVDETNSTGLKTSIHTVTSGETLDTIAKKFNVTADTIRWYNSSLISPFSNQLQIGWGLKIPLINGVLYTVRANQSLNDVIAATSANNSESNNFNIVEFNNLTSPYTLHQGQQLFIPDGNLIKQSIQVAGIPKGVFINPLTDSSCSGYTESRGFTSYHDGVDLAKWTGCNLEAVATGTIIYAGWENISGNCIKIDHGGGIVSYYYHLKEIYVKVGQRVQQGESIAYMGSTGNSTGTHLHFTLKKDGEAVDPALYVPVTP